MNYSPCKQTKNPVSEIASVNPSNDSPLCTNGSDTRPFLRIKVGNNLSNKGLAADLQITFLVDSGAACSLLLWDDYEKLELPIEASCPVNALQLVAANGTRLPVTHKVMLNLTIGGRNILHPFHVSRNINHSIIGWDAIKKYNIILANGEFFVDGDASRKLNKLYRHNNVIAKRKYELKPGECKQILGRIRKTAKINQGEPVLIDDVRSVKDCRRNSSIRAMPGLYDFNNQGNVKIEVCNLTTEPIRIKPGEIVAVFDTLVQPPVDQFRPDYKHVDVDFDNIINTPIRDFKRNKTLKELMAEMQIGPMNPNERLCLERVVNQSIYAFARN